MRKWHNSCHWIHEPLSGSSCNTDRNNNQYDCNKILVVHLKLNIISLILLHLVVAGWRQAMTSVRRLSNAFKSAIISDFIGYNCTFWTVDDFFCTFTCSLFQWHFLKWIHFKLSPALIFVKGSCPTEILWGSLIKWNQHWEILILANFVDPEKLLIDVCLMRPLVNFSS